MTMFLCLVSALIGAAFTLGASVLVLTGHHWGAYLLLGLLVVAASLEAFVGLCLGCKVFALLMRVGVIPESVCERCNDLWGTQALRRA